MSRKTIASTFNCSFQLLIPKLHCIGFKCNSIHTTAKEIKIPVPWGHISGKLWGKENRRPVLALHGWQDNAGTWDLLAPMICDKIPILAIDFPGHGFSSWIPPGFHYYFWDLPRLILSIKDYFKWDKISILGHSMGSIAGMRFACVFPDDIDFYIAIDFILYDEHNFNQVVESIPNILSKLQLYQTRLNKEPPEYTMDEIKQIWHLGTLKSVELDRVQYLATRGTKVSWTDPNKFYFSRDARLKYMLNNPENKSFVDTLVKRLKCPTIYFNAIDSSFASDKYSVEVREVIEKNNPKFECHFVPGTHHVHLNNPERLAPTIINFLQKYNIF